jgi:hypothetical protein
MDCRPRRHRERLSPADDEVMLQLMKQAGKTGIDCPLLAHAARPLHSSSSGFP